LISVLTVTLRENVLYPRVVDEETAELSNSPKVIQIDSGGARMQNQETFLQTPSSKPQMPLDHCHHHVAQIRTLRAHTQKCRYCPYMQALTYNAVENVIRKMLIFLTAYLHLVILHSTKTGALTDQGHQRFLLQTYFSI